MELPEGVSATIEGPMLTIKGPKGELTRKVGAKGVELTLTGTTLAFTSRSATRKHKRMLNTGLAHAKNMARGAREGHTYNLKICSGHFPMTVAIKDGVFEVKNFIGESVPRRLKLMDGVDVKINGQEVVVTSSNKDKAGNQAAAIELLTRRPGFDSRIFQDGIYITHKDGKQV